MAAKKKKTRAHRPHPKGDLGDVVASEACQTSRPWRFPSTRTSGYNPDKKPETPWTEAEKARRDLGLTLPLMREVFGERSARRVFWHALRGTIVAEEIEGAGIAETDIDTTGCLTIAELHIGRKDVPTYARAMRCFEHGTGVAFCRVFQPPDVHADLCTKTPDRVLNEKPDDQLERLFRCFSMSVQPMRRPSYWAMSLVQTLCCLTAYRDEPWTVPPEGALTSAEVLRRSLAFLGVVGLSADTIFADVAERFWAIRQAWLKGERIDLPNGRRLGPWFGMPKGFGEKLEPPPLPLFGGKP